MKTKLDLKDTTFLILVRIDSVDRIENILTVTDLLISDFVTHINVLESSEYNNGLLKKLLNYNINYRFQEDNDPILFRTKLLNQMLKEVSTPFVAIWDTDVIVSPKQIIDSINILKSGEADFVYPYENLFLDIPPIIKKLFFNEKDLIILESNKQKMTPLYLPNPVGGGFFANMSAYKNSGLENETYYGWGLEDGERFTKWINKGYKVKRVTGPIYHLCHSRGKNSTFHNPDQQIIKLKNSLANSLKSKT